METEIQEKKEEKLRVKNSGKGRIFQSNFLEVFTRTGPVISFFTYGGLISFYLFLSWHNEVATFWKSLPVYLFGVVLWTLVEYVMHRYVFHFINESKLVQRFHYTFHGVHHEYPRDEERVFMPPVPGILISSMYFGLFFLLAGKYAFLLTAGLITGYSIYSYIHWGIHKFNAPKVLQPLWTHHLVHHYQQPDKAFGVTNRFWDRVFGTMPNLGPK